MPGILSSSIVLMAPMLRGLQHESPETKHSPILDLLLIKYFQYYTVQSEKQCMQFLCYPNNIARGEGEKLHSFNFSQVSLGLLLFISKK